MFEYEIFPDLLADCMVKHHVVRFFIA